MCLTWVKCFFSLVILATLCGHFSVAIITEIKAVTLDQLDEIKKEKHAVIYFHDTEISNTTKHMLINFNILFYFKNISEGNQFYSIKIEQKSHSGTFTEKFDDEVTFAKNITWKLTKSKLPVLVEMAEGHVLKVTKEISELEGLTSDAATWMDHFTELHNYIEAQRGSTHGSEAHKKE
ncbi:hypothetical protein Ddc_17575 [Ditylenchus destructor]|nr:hypothetical protein Ddc_17575 [Ditylenchus destructor]